MIKLFFSSIVFTTLLNPVFAAFGTDPTIVTRTVSISSKFNKIVLNGDADVVFVKDDNKAIIIEERIEIENSVKIKNREGVITINSKEIYKGKRPVIRIPVSNLNSLELNGNGSVRTAGLLQAKELRVFVNGEIEVHILTSGSVFFESSPEYDLNYKKQRPVFLPALLQ